MIRNLIWDVDGTLFDTYPSIATAYAQALGSLGGSASLQEISSLAKVSLSHCARILSDRFGVAGEELSRCFTDRYGAISASAQLPFGGAREVCARILALGGQNTIATHRGRESTMALLEAHGMRELFSQVVSVDEGFPKKPDPAAFLSIMERAALRPEETAAIGDRDIDVLAGKAAGVRTCLFRGAPGEAGADVLFDDYVELPALLGLWTRPP